MLQRWRLDARTRCEWYRSLASLIRGGMPLESILESMQGEFMRTQHALLPAVEILMLRLRGGDRTPLPKGADRRRTVGTELTGLVPPVEALLIDAGESAGDLGLGFVRAANYLEAMMRLRRELLAPLREPLMLVAMLLGLLSFFSLQVLPSFADISPRSQWPGAAQAYGALADHAIALSAASIGVIGGGVWLVLWLARQWVGPLRDRMDRGVWPWTLVARVYSATMLVSISGFVSAGISFDSAITQLQAGSDLYMQRVYGHLRDGLRNGLAPHDALCELSLMDPACHWLLRLYGRSSDFSDAMQILSDQMIAFVIRRAKAFSTFLNVSLKLLVAGFVVWTLVAMYGVVGSVRKGHAAAYPSVNHSTGTGVFS
jgi:type II secretory pathway component PulF